MDIVPNSLEPATPVILSPEEQETARIAKEQETARITAEKEAARVAAAIRENEAREQARLTEMLKVSQTPDYHPIKNLEPHAPRIPSANSSAPDYHPAAPPPVGISFKVGGVSSHPDFHPSTDGFKNQVTPVTTPLPPLGAPDYHPAR